MRWIGVIGLVACSGGKGGDEVDVGDADTDTDADTDADADADADADTDTDPTVPTTVEVTCAGTANPLRFTCTVTVDPPQAVTLTASRQDGSGARVVEGADTVGTHELGVVFLAPDTDYDVSVEAGGSTANTTFHTGTVPTEVSSSLTVTGAAGTPYLGASLPCTPNVPAAAVWDTATGELVWYQAVATSGSFDGFAMVQFTEDHTLLGMTGRQVVEVDLMGNDLLRQDYDENYNHDLYRKDGLTWLVFSENVGSATLQGFTVWDATGTELARFHEGDVLPIPGNARGDYTHMNSLFVGDDHHVIMSLLHQDTIFSVDGDPASPTFGELDWILGGGPGADFGNDFAIDWTAVDGSNEFSGQHAASWRSDGRLQLLDNDDGRGLVATVDTAGMAVTIDESYASGQRLCGPQGTMTTEAGGRILVGCSGTSVREFEPLGTTPSWTARIGCAAGPTRGMGPMRYYALDGW